MKLRIRNNSVRFRLTQSEVRRLAQSECVEQATGFSATSRLVSSVESSARLRNPVATFDGTRISVMLPAEQVREWAISEEVAIEMVQSIADGETLRILVEKDFQCLHSRAEGDLDAFPNPRSI